MISQIRQKEVDIAFTSIWIIATHYHYANLTESIALTKIHFLVPRPKPYKIFWAVTKTLTPIVWLLIIIMVITQSIIVNARARLFPLKVPKSNWQIDTLTLHKSKRRYFYSAILTGFQSFAMTWIEVIGRLLNTTSLNTIQGFKIIFQLWAMTSVLLITAYSSNLAAKFASPLYEKRWIDFSIVNNFCELINFSCVAGSILQKTLSKQTWLGGGAVQYLNLRPILMNL